MSDTSQYIAVDLGAESGRVMLGTIADGKLKLDEIHRFANAPVEQAGTLRWDFNALFGEIKAGLTKAVKQADHKISGIAVDSWGVDFGLVYAEGNLIEDPYNYRDSRTDGMVEKACELLDKRAIYDNTGIQFMQLNTLFQVLSMRLAEYPALARTSKIIFMADLVAYYLTGKAYAEYSLASTSQMMDMQTGQWSAKLFEALLLPMDIMPDVVQPGTEVGVLKAEIAAEIGCDPIKVIAAGSHDTASAVAAVPASDENWAYLSCGTWSLMGVESDDVVINNDTYEYSFTNEGGVGNTIRLLKNIMGLWVLQQCRSDWNSSGEELSYSQIAEMAGAAEPFKAFVCPNDSTFFAPGNMPERINEYLKSTGQEPIEDKGQMARVVLEGLALTYRWVFDKLQEVTGKRIDVLHIVGGGIKNELLCQFAANAIGRKVITGPVEATASGNIIMQAIGTGDLGSLAEARKLVGNSFDLKEYLPQDVDLWEKQYKKIEDKIKP